MRDEKSILYVVTTEEPTKQYSPLVLAQTAAMMELKPMVYYLGTSLKMLKPGEAEKISLGNFPTVANMIKKTMEMNIPIYVCEASKQMLGLDKIELIPGLKIVGAGTLNDLALESGATMWF
jgi:predicted peroxiredoxin